MKEPQAGSNWFFVDESGDPTFYDRKGNLIENPFDIQKSPPYRLDPVTGCTAWSRLSPTEE